MEKTFYLLAGMVYYTGCMDIGKILYLALQGFFLGFGPCLVTCAPIMLPIAGTKKTWQEGFFAALSFSLGRVAVYMVLGGLFGYFGAFILKYYYSSGFYYYIQTILSVFLVSIGVAVLMGKDIRFRFCGMGEGHTALLGVLVGLSPCIPLIGVLLEIAFISDNFLSGLIYSLAFGIGTIISPLLLLGAVIPLVGGRIDQRIFKVFTYLCGLMLIFGGIYIFFRGGAPSVKA
jgi:sulfite exporter TauE/SafE